MIDLGLQELFPMSLKTSQHNLPVMDGCKSFPSRNIMMSKLITVALPVWRTKRVHAHLCQVTVANFLTEPYRKSFSHPAVTFSAGHTVHPVFHVELLNSLRTPTPSNQYWLLYSAL